MWRLFFKSEPQLLTRRVLRLKFEYCVVLRVRAPSWKDAVLSRFISEDRRMAEGKEKAEAVLQALRDAGLVLRVKKHLTKDGAKLLLVFVTADLRRLEQQSQRLFIERWLQEEGIGDTMGEHGRGSSIAARRAATKPAMRIVRVGGLHYFASDPTAAAAAAAAAGGGGGAAVDVQGERGGADRAARPHPALARRAGRRRPRGAAEGVEARRRYPGCVPAARRALERRAAPPRAPRQPVHPVEPRRVPARGARPVRREGRVLLRVQLLLYLVAPRARHPRRAALDDLLLRRVAAAAARAAVRRLHRDLGFSDDEGVAAPREQARARLGRRQPAAGRGDPQGVRGVGADVGDHGRERAALPRVAALRQVRAHRRGDADAGDAQLHLHLQFSNYSTPPPLRCRS